MRTKLLLIALMGLLVTITSAEKRHSIHHCGNDDYDDDYYEDYYDDDDYYEKSCSNDYGYYDKDFIIGNRVYHWFTNHYGRRILKSRQVYHDPHYGVYYGPWEIAYHFDWDHYNHWYFTWCPDLGLYYYNHPHYVSHYHNLHSQVTFHVNFHNFHPGHIVVQKPWIHWKPWKFWKHKKWNTVWHPKHKIIHAYKPHIKHGKVYKVHGKKHGKHYIYENTKKHRRIYKNNNTGKHGKIYTNSGNQIHRKTVIKKKYKNPNNNNKYIVKKKPKGVSPVPNKTNQYNTIKKSNRNSVKTYEEPKKKTYNKKLSNKPARRTEIKNKSLESYTFNRKVGSNKNMNTVKLTNNIKTYRRNK